MILLTLILLCQQQPQAQIAQIKADAHQIRADLKRMKRTLCSVEKSSSVSSKPRVFRMVKANTKVHTVSR